MNFSLNVICKNASAEHKKRQIEAMLAELGISSEVSFTPYWKDKSLSQTIFGVPVQSPDFDLISRCLSEIAGGQVDVSVSMEEWEFTHYASMEELSSENGNAFVVCGIF